MALSKLNDRDRKRFHSNMSPAEKDEYASLTPILKAKVREAWKVNPAYDFSSIVKTRSFVSSDRAESRKAEKTYKQLVRDLGVPGAKRHVGLCQKTPGWIRTDAADNKFYRWESKEEISADEVLKVKSHVSSADNKRDEAKPRPIKDGKK